MKKLLKKIKMKLKEPFKTLNKEIKDVVFINYDERELRQKRITEKWTPDMIAEYYKVSPNFMKEVLEYYNIR